MAFVGGWVGFSSDRVFVVVSVQSQCLDFNLDFKIKEEGDGIMGGQVSPCLQMQMIPLITVTVVVSLE